MLKDVKSYASVGDVVGQVKTLLEGTVTKWLHRHPQFSPEVWVPSFELRLRIRGRIANPPGEQGTS